MAAADFIFPYGQLKPEFLPNDDLTSVVTIWLEVAEDKTEGLDEESRTDAVEAYVYWRGFLASATYKASIPAQESADGGTYNRTHTADQLAHFQRLAREYESTFLTLVGKSREVPVLSTARTFKPRF